MDDQTQPQQSQESLPDSSGQPIYDISGKDPALGTIPHEQVQDAVLSGQYSLPKSQDINVISPDGKLGNIPSEEAKDAFNSGYQYATPKMVQSAQDQEQYGGTGSQIAAGLEGAAQGLAGPLATGAERLLGVDPEGIRKRAEYNPWTHGISEAVGFGAGALTGTGEAALLSKAGEGAAGLAGLGEATSVGGKLAAGATKMGAEMALMQSGDEANKVLTNAPETIGNAAANIGLSTLIGGVGGGLFSGLGMAAKSAINAPFLKDFAKEMGILGSGVDRNQALMDEVQNGVKQFDQMKDDIWGGGDIKSKAIEKLMPEATPENVSKIDDHLLDISNQASKRIEDASDNAYLKGAVPKLEQDLKNFNDVITDPNASIGDKWNALNDYKNASQAHANYGYKGSDEAALSKWIKPFNSTLKESAENTDIWGKAGDFQKNLNFAFTQAKPFVDDIKSKFFDWVGNNQEISAKRFETYVNQGGKATSETQKQKIMGGFADGLEGFNKARNDAFEKAGVENPNVDNVIPTGAMRDSMGKQSPGVKFARLWHDKLGSSAIGSGVGALIGNAALPGFGGAFIGKEVLGPAFGSIIQPILEKTTNSTGYQQTMKFGKSVLAGNNALVSSAKNIFESGSKTVPQHVFADKDKLNKLDDQIKQYAANPNKMLNMTGELAHYTPAHAQALTQTTQQAVNYLNSQRPKPQQLSPLDSKIEPTKAQEATYQRTLSVAQNPLIALDHIKNGTLLPQDVATVKTIYPAYYPKMSQEIMNAMLDHKAKDGDVPYNIRQSCSLFLGQPLDSTMTPSSIQSVQNVYASKQQPPQNAPVTKNKRNTSKLGKLADGMQTASQASEARHNTSAD